MNDTTPEIAVKMREMFQKKTPAQRLMMGCSMYDFSKQLMVSSILRQKPGISLPALRRELFLRFYGNILKPAVLDRIALS